ncbi:Trihelix transcription factor GTL1 [Hirschfeldia incana]|nr:Trihelix transcription factor GTL1 [Hirschfeldia incana]
MEQGAGGGGGNEVVEEASPISSRPPANMEELMRFSAAADDGGGLGGGGGSSSSSSGNRWPREETLALLRIRSEMDSTFRDATLKAPLWEHVSRKLLELGYKRSAKKCKEKFENVQKYYKRTKETRGGRHDGKAYKFFSELEALNTTTPPPSSSLDATPLSVANPIQPPPPSSSQFTVFPLQQQIQPLQPHSVSFTPNVAPPPAPMGPTFPGATFSSHSSSTASGMGSDDDDEEDIMDVDQAGPSSRKRKRGNRGGGKMVELFEGLVRQVIQKQAAMQRSFLEALEKREQERLGREEAWKRQEMSRLAREHEIMAQERAASASRDAAIISLIQKITGHTIHLPPSLSSQPPQPSPPPPQPAAKRPSSQPPQLQPIMAIPQQQVLPPPPPQPQQQQPPPPQQEMIMCSDQSSSPSSSRWPKAEILALINLRSGMEPRYQDNVPKGLLWEEISSSMKRMGYNRNAKRCKEKWENINKYYKKVKESNKERPQDAKTCPYFHRLDLLYRNKVLGSGGSSSASGLPHQDQTSTAQKQSPVSAVKPPQGVVNVHKPHGSAASSEEEEPREENPQGTEKKTL